MPAILAAIPAGIIAAGKTAASVGVTATGAVAGYAIIKKIEGKPEPMVSHAILLGALETK